MTARLLPFISRHAPTVGQDRLVQRLGYAGLQWHPLVFSSNPVADLDGAGLSNMGCVALVGPVYVALALLRAGFTIMEFVNAAEAREASAFRCTGVWCHTIHQSEYFASASGDGGTATC